MRNIMIFAAIMIGLGTFMAQMADKMSSASATSAPRTTVALAATPPASSRSLTIPATRAAISRPKGGSTDSVSASWSIPAPPWWR